MTEAKSIATEAITAEEIERWGDGVFGNHAHAWFAEVLNGTYGVEDARADCLSVVRPDARPGDL